MWNDRYPQNKQSFRSSASLNDFFRLSHSLHYPALTIQSRNIVVQLLLIKHALNICLWLSTEQSETIHLRYRSRMEQGKGMFNYILLEVVLYGKMILWNNRKGIATRYTGFSSGTLLVVDKPSWVVRCTAARVLEGKRYMLHCIFFIELVRYIIGRG